MMNTALKLSLLSAALFESNAFAPSTTFTRNHASTSLQMQGSSNDVSRVEFFQQIAGLSVATAFSSSLSLPAFAEGGDPINLPSGVSYTVTKAGDGPKPDIGELAGIRFKAVCVPTGNTVDDIFETPEPYYTRVGSGGLVKVREDTAAKYLLFF